ncbi:MAG: DUF559 domain-containing protein [Acidimicrobiales bacterium]
MSSLDSRIAALAAGQCGVFARWQVVAIGGTDGYIRRRVCSGRWLPIRPGVYQLAGSPPSDDQRYWIAWLAVGPQAALSHECAAERHGLIAVPRARLVLTNRHGAHHRIDGVCVHQLDDLLPHHVMMLGGLPTTTVERTIIDLAAVLSRARVTRALEQAVIDRKTTDDAVGAVLTDVKRPRKPGMRLMARVLDDRAPGDPISNNVLEQLLLDAVRRGGSPDPKPQFAHPGRHPARGCVDFAYPDVKLILEADGRRWHQRIADLKRDRARDNEAARAGWLTMRFMHEELRSDPEDVGAAVREVRASRQ